MTSAQHRRTVAAALTLVTIAAGLVWRLGSLHLPFVAYKYGGSMLWAAAIYFLVVAVFPRWSIATAATTTATLATSVEFFKLYHSPAMDAFRLTLPGKILLGRFFSWKDLAAYGFAISVAALVDRVL
jgi:hypothetical protein